MTGHAINAPAVVLLNTRQALKGNTPKLRLQVCAIRYFSEVPGLDPRAILFIGWDTGPSPLMFSTLLEGWEWILVIDAGDGSFESFPLYATHLSPEGTMTVPSADIRVHRNIDPSRRRERPPSALFNRATTE